MRPGDRAVARRTASLPSLASPARRGRRPVLDRPAAALRGWAAAAL